ncbi:hypothetical protein ACEWY4_008826 [Coilia grayii]|uniref:Centrosomal protein of 126 kDa n=1 Tax=Coilia grayii TaxID=363190 RepID=A0ABD1KCV0_9TELE
MDYDGALENERQVLLQDQKACRVRAHKFHLETSRRRKALEDRRRQWDVQEQRIRENILQLRKQRMQEATERFQRAHIRPSQRKRPAFVKRTVNIDEALSLIDARGTYTKPSAALLTNSYMGRNSTPPPRSQTFAISARHQREQMATGGSTEQQDRQRNYRASQPFFLGDLQEAQGVVKDEESVYSWEEDAEDASSPSDSLSSQDSLEVEDLKHRQQLKCGGCCQSSPTASEKDSPLAPQAHHPPRGTRPSSATRHYTINCQSEPLVPSSPANDSSDPRPSLRDDVVKQMGSLHSLSSAATNHSVKEPSPDTQEQGVLGSHSHCNQLRAEDNLSHMTRHCCTRAVSEAAAEAHREAMVNHHHAKTAACPGCGPTELSCWEQQCRTVSEQPRGQGEDESEYRLTTTQVRQMSSNVCKQQRDTPYKTFVSVVEAVTQRASASDNQTSGPVNCHQSNRPQPHPDAVHREEGHRQLSRTTSTCALPMTADVRILKSILKKQSKYDTKEAKFVYSPGHLTITKHMAMSLRDSIELIRGRAKEPENSKTVKKKLRWFDEVNARNHDTTIKDSVISTPAKSRPPVSYNQQGLNQVICAHAHADAVSTTMSAVASSPGPQGPSAKQAWADASVAVAMEDSKWQEPSQEVPKVQRTFLCAGVPRVPRRVRSARVGTDLTPSCVRKDIVSRPQSASEASSVLRNQRRMMMMMAPCPPPPRPEAGQADRQTGAADCTKAAAGRTVQHRPGADGHAVCAPDEGGGFAPCPPPFAAISSETGGQKGRVSFSQHGSHASVRRCGAACEENDIFLNRTPTDDEISQLWNGLRTALSTKDARRPVRRASQEANGSKKRMSAQHTTQIPGSANKKLSSPNQASLMTMPLPREVQDQGLSQRRGPPQHPPVLSLSALSLEEQRVQQSLDRLNQRLQYVVGDNTSMKRLFHTEGAHPNMSAKFGEGTNSAARRLSTTSSTR